MTIRENEPLAKHTVFKIGGPARYFCEVDSAKKLVEAIKWSGENEHKFFILGAGSNVLVSDKGFDGLIIKNRADKIELLNRAGINKAEAGLASPKLYAEAGAQMARVVAESVKAGLAGFEWAIGVPGTIGGSVRGNAGCFGSEMKDFVESVEVFDTEKLVSRQLSNVNCNFGYRHSFFKENPNLIILSAILKLQTGDPKKSQALIGEYSKKRAQSQDIGEKCAGCIFKNVEWSRKDIDKSKLLAKFPELKQFSNQKSIPSGFLIDALGLKGQKIGGVKISRLHANYFINIAGSATYEDVLMLAGLVKERVHNYYDILLEKEIQLLF